MTETALKALAEALQTSQIKEVDLKRNQMGSEGAGSALAQVLGKMPDLEKVRPAR